MKFLSFKTLLIADIVSTLTIAIMSVGETSKSVVYDWTIVPAIMLTILTPAILGYLAAWEDD